MIRKIIAYLKNNKKQTCHFHEYYISETSNILQLDEMGFTYEQLDDFIRRCENSEVICANPIEVFIYEKHIASEFKRKLAPAFDVSKVGGMKK